jgi:hypothetical protein
VAADAAAVREWVRLLSLAGLAGHAQLHADDNRSGGCKGPLDLRAVWAAGGRCRSCSGSTASSAGAGVEEKDWVEVDDGELLGRLVELPGGARGGSSSGSTSTSSSRTTTTTTTTTTSTTTSSSKNRRKNSSLISSYVGENSCSRGLHVRASSGAIGWWHPLGASFVLGDLLACGAPALAPLLNHGGCYEVRATTLFRLLPFF